VRINTCLPPPITIPIARHRRATQRGGHPLVAPIRRRLRWRWSDGGSEREFCSAALSRLENCSPSDLPANSVRKRPHFGPSQSGKRAEENRRFKRRRRPDCRTRRCVTVPDSRPRWGIRSSIHAPHSCDGNPRPSNRRSVALAEAFFSCGRDLVPDALAGHLALELNEGQQHLVAPSRRWPNPSGRNADGTRDGLSIREIA
jgi:hypothetical protein